MTHNAPNENKQISAGEFLLIMSLPLFAGGILHLSTEGGLYLFMAGAFFLIYLELSSRAEQVLNSYLDHDEKVFFDPKEDNTKMALNGECSQNKVGDPNKDICGEYN